MLAWKNSGDKGLAFPPSPPASAPDSIVHQAPHTTLSTSSRPLTSDERAYPCTQPAHTAHTPTHTIPLVQAHVDRSTHTFTLTDAPAGCSRP